MGTVTLSMPAGAAPQVRVARVEYISVLANALDVVGGMDRGLPAPWANQIRSAIGRRGMAAFGPMARSRMVPDCLAPRRVAPVDPSIDSDLETLFDLRPDEVTSSIEAEFDVEMPVSWRVAADRPSAWSRACADSMTAAAGAIDPLWKQAQPLLDRETERIGIASVRSALPTLLATLNPRIGFADGVLTFEHPAPGNYDLGTKDLVLVPMATGSRMLMLSDFGAGRSVWIGYPVPGLDAVLASTPGRTRPDGLAALLGPVRASILREIGQPRTVSDLAVRIQRPASTVTVQCDRMLAAGLITRRRQGRSVWIERTGLGNVLLDSYRG